MWNLKPNKVVLGCFSNVRASYCLVSALFRRTTGLALTYVDGMESVRQLAETTKYKVLTFIRHLIFLFPVSKLSGERF